MEKYKQYYYLPLALLVVIFIASTFFIVGPGEVGVKFNRITGKATAHLRGTHFKVPGVQAVTIFDVKTQRTDISADSASKDLQYVGVDVVINYHLKYDAVNELYVKVGEDYRIKVIEPAVKEAVKSSAAKFPVEEIIVKRSELKEMVEENLKGRLLPYNIILESVNLTDIKFSSEFNKVVEEKQIEEQKIRTAEYKRQQAEKEKQRVILQAQAEAEKQRLIKQMLTANIVSLEWIKKWDGKLPEIMMSDKSNILLPLAEKRNK